MAAHEDESLHQRDGFTLVELLVVIAIITILAGLLLPTLRQAVTSARTITCMNNQRQIALLVDQYADEHGGLLPAGRWGPGGFDASIWNVHLSKYTPRKIPTYQSAKNKGTVFDCPELSRTYWNHLAFGWNIHLPPPNNYSAFNVHGQRTRIKKPSRTRLVADATYVWIGGSTNRTFRHNDGDRINLLHADLHVETLNHLQYNKVGEKGY